MNMLDIFVDFCKCIIEGIFVVLSILWIPVKYILVMDGIIVVVGALILLLAYLYQKVRRH